MIEAALIGLVFAAVASRRALRDAVRAAPRRYRIFALAISAVMLAGQLTGDPEATYPFVNWAMYTQPVPGDPEYTYLTLIRPDASVEAVPIETLFSGASVQLRGRLRKLTRELDQLAEGPQRDRVRETFEATLASIARRYRDEHPDAGLQALRYSRCYVAVRAATGLGPPRCQVILEVDVTES